MCAAFIYSALSKTELGPCGDAAAFSVIKIAEQVSELRGYVRVRWFKRFYHPERVEEEALQGG